MGFVTLGLFIFNADGMLGAIIQMLSHGFISAAMFLCVGVLYDRVHSRMIADYGGVANKMPVFAAFFVFFAMANSGLPGTSRFVGEVKVVLGTIKVNFWYAFLAATTLIFGAAYTLWMVKRVVYGGVANPNVAGLEDVGRRELVFLAILAALVLWMGVQPKPFADAINPTVQELLRHVGQSKVS
jgi:NADH-quinone oxidoreductase subunit M